MNQLDCKVATMADLPALCRFYQDICDHQKFDDYGADWHWGIYPAESDLKEAIEKEQALIGLKDGKIAAAGLLMVGNDPLYSKFDWPTKADDDEIAVIHLYSLHPAFRRQGLSASLLLFAEDRAKSLGCKVIRLDSMAGNRPARRLYEKNGFSFVQQANVHYDDIGDTDVDLLECPL